MRLFHIQPDGSFAEYMQTPFETEHQEAELENWLESNPESLLDDGGIVVIGRQVLTDLGGYIDLLGADRQGNVVIVELKRDRSPRQSIAQALEYASYVEQLDMQELESILSEYKADEGLILAEYHRVHFDLRQDEAPSFNKDQRIVIVGQRVTREIIQTAEFLNAKGVRIACIEFSFFEDDKKSRVMSMHTVVDDKPATSPTPRPTLTEAEFMASLDENGRHVFTKMLEFGKQRSLPIWWGSVGFNLRVKLDETYVVFGYGYIPDCKFGQSFYTYLLGDSSVAVKSAMPEETILSLHRQAEETGLLVPAGKNLKLSITRRLTKSELDALLAWCESVYKAIREYGLK